MKLGLGMHPERWSDAHLAMARQLGCETVVPWVPFGPGDDVWHEEQFAASGRIGYVHFRNTSGTRPRYNEVFIDDGYVDMKRAMAIYEKCGFDGTVIPDHTPRLTAADWWETGMAFALGYMRGILRK